MSYYYNDSFDSFIRLIEKADLTYEEKFIDSDKELKTNKIELKFNYYSDISIFRNTLSSLVYDVKKEIMNEIIDLKSRFEKLVYISSKISELKKVIDLITGDADEYVHKNFKYSNISKLNNEVEYKQKDVQDYYGFMKQYSNEVLEYLQIVYESANKSSIEDFPKKVKSPPNPNVATLNKPLAFFEYFFIYKGFTRFHNNFFPDQEAVENYNIVEVNKETEIITFEEYNSETGEYYTYRREFKQELLNEIYRQYLIARRYIDERIDSLHSEEEIKLYLKILLYKIRYLETSILKYEEANKYDTGIKATQGFIRYIFEKYEPFVTPFREEEYFKKILNQNIEEKFRLDTISTNSINLTAQENIISFRWKDRIQERSIILHRLLIDKKFISADVPLDHFSKAFEGISLNPPLNIKWIRKVKGKLSKPMILFLVDQLKERGYIEPVSSDQEMYKKVQRIFLDHEGKPLQHLNVSSLQIKKRKAIYTLQEKEIMELMDILA